MGVIAIPSLHGFSYCQWCSTSTRSLYRYCGGYRDCINRWIAFQYFRSNCSIYRHFISHHTTIWTLADYSWQRCFQGLILVIMAPIAIIRSINWYIPLPVTLGFTYGIGITIGTLQIKDFLGFRHCPYAHLSLY